MEPNFVGFITFFNIIARKLGLEKQIISLFVSWKSMGPSPHDSWFTLKDLDVANDVGEVEVAKRCRTGENEELQNLFAEEKTTEENKSQTSKHHEEQTRTIEKTKSCRLN
jgi:hypothetical protein